jgi:hypothetical protein
VEKHTVPRERRRRGLHAGAVLFALGAAGCGLTADFSGLQGGTKDAGADAGTSFCASLAQPVQLCADFDEGAAVDHGWQATDVYGGETVSVDTAAAFSPPGSFLSTINPGGAPSSARLLQSTPTGAQHIHVAFEFSVTQSGGTLELCAVHQVTSDGSTYGLFYREVGGQLQVRLYSLVAGSTFDQSWPIGQPPSTWTRVDLDLELSSTAGAFVVQHDGATVVSQAGVPTSTPDRTAMFVELGFYSYTPASGQGHFDNVTIDWL